MLKCEYEKMALLVRREHLEALNDPDTAAFMKQIAEEFSQYLEEGEDEDPNEFGMDFTMRIVEGINEAASSNAIRFIQKSILPEQAMVLASRHLHKTAGFGHAD